MQVGGCEPNAASYRMMVLKVLTAMLASRHCPRLDTFECLVTGLLKCGQINDACFVLEEMEKRNMQFHLEAWEALVMGACGEDIVAGDVATDLDSAH
ncbi:hypothetical protein DVH24_032769 [Malus domestica]|uniref:Pentatricopeptide repeat-containing protein n=1 Tax=Malus domestica TaxID=3750 RepID=A0A498IQQ9_MALDO|nr:hypothetical protein DVH24_032769 [Malus domestica]